MRRLNRSVLVAGMLLGQACAQQPPVLPGPGSRPSVNGVDPDDSLVDGGSGPLDLVSRPVEPPLDYRIGPGDALVITVFEAEELNRTTQVTESGAVSLPLVGEVRAAGRSARELEVSIAEALKSYIIDPHVSVEISAVQSRPVTVVGAVQRPGALQLRGPRSLLEVLAMAGGLSEEAGDDVLLVRANALAVADSATEPEEGGLRLADAVVEVDLQRLLNSGSPQRAVLVYPGDVVRVKEAGVIYVLGEVGQPGGFPLKAGSELTLLQAVALGEGLRPTAAPGRTLIIRQTADGERTELPVDLGAVIAGRIPDPRLEARDIVFVPNSAAKSVVYGLANALVRMVTLRGLF